MASLKKVKEKLKSTIETIPLFTLDEKSDSYAEWLKLSHEENKKWVANPTISIGPIPKPGTIEISGGDIATGIIADEGSGGVIWRQEPVEWTHVSLKQTPLDFLRDKEDSIALRMTRLMSQNIYVVFGEDVASDSLYAGVSDMDFKSSLHPSSVPIFNPYSKFAVSFAMTSTFVKDVLQPMEHKAVVDFLIKRIYDHI